MLDVDQDTTQEGTTLTKRYQINDAKTTDALELAVPAFFGVVLGLLAWFGLQATATIYAAEADVARARHFWPRSIRQPPLTFADEGSGYGTAGRSTKHDRF